VNERIRELAKEAMEWVPNGDDDSQYQLNPNKFAKLIVRECADVCQQVTSSGMFDGNQQYASAYCRDEIKRHFGVGL